MKITQTNNSLDIKTGGLTQLVLGFIFVAVGIAIAAIFFLGVKDSNTGQSASPWLVVVGLVFALAGVVTGLFAKKTQITLSKDSHSTITSKRLVGGKLTHQTFSTTDIAAVELSTITEVNTGENNTTSRRSSLSLILKNNDHLPIATKSSSGGISVNNVNVSSFFQKAPLSKEANQIAQFLGVPLQTGGITTPASDNVLAGYPAANPTQPIPPNDINPPQVTNPKEVPSNSFRPPEQN